MLHGYTNVPVEFALSTTTPYGDIFNDIELDVVFTGPDGTSWRVPAFWSGDSAFRVRFAAPTPGRYTYRSVCTNTEDAGLHGMTGEIEVILYTGNNPLYRRGRLRVSENKRYLEHADGTPFFWLGDTWWSGLTTRISWPQDFQRITADRVAKGMNLIQIVVGPMAGTDVRNLLQRNEGGWSWDEGWTRINPAYFDQADLRISYLIEHGLMPCIFPTWGYILLQMGTDVVKKHWRNLVARYGAYPVVWSLAGELNASWEPEIQARLKDEWSEVGQYLREIDPFGTLITAHPSWPHSSREMVHDESLLDFDMLQSGHGGHAVALPLAVEMAMKSYVAEPTMPVVNGEPCYEGIQGTGWQEMQRFLFWTTITCGACGITYGAEGLMNMISPEAVHDPERTFWGEHHWQEALNFPGAAQMGIGRRFFERYPWWRFVPRHEPETEKMGHASSFATGIPDVVAIYYLPAQFNEDRMLGALEEKWPKGQARITIEVGATYAAFFFNPRTGQEIDAGSVQPDENGVWVSPKKPNLEDWVLVLENKDKLAELTG